MRVPRPHAHFLINPFGLHYTGVTASNLVKVDLEGNLVDPVLDALLRQVDKIDPSYKE